MNEIRVSLVMATMLFLSTDTLTAQPRHRLHSNGRAFLMEDLATGRKKPFDMWIIRCANAAFDRRFTDAVIANLDDYQRYGLNTLVVSIQGGNPGKTTYPRVYNADGTLMTSSVVWNNLRSLLEETDKRGMALFVQYWYFLMDQNVPDDGKALEITGRVTEWLKNTGYQHYLLDVVNEFGHGAYSNRPLFTTAEGALKIVEAVKMKDAAVLTGISPPSRIMAPVGTLSNPTRTVQADIIIGHNQVCDPANPGCYRYGPRPAGYASMPYMNNEFWAQTTYERTLRINPRTGLKSYGHFDQYTVNYYLQELETLRALGGYGNIHAQYLQQVVKDAETPVATVGPAGTQPESPASPGEPSLHWLYREIARIRSFGPVPLVQDFNAGYAAGAELDLGGTWEVSDGYLKQTDDEARVGHARFTADDGDLDIVFDGGFIDAPGSGSWLGIQLGGAARTDPGYRLRVYRDRVVFDKVGVTFTPLSVPLFKLFQDQFGLRIAGGRIQVQLYGRTVIDVEDKIPIDGRNLHLLTEDASARFDNLRATPVRFVDFEEDRTGAWSAEHPSAWAIVPSGTANKAWQATVAAGKVERAVLDLAVGDFELAFDVDLTEAPAMSVHFRSKGLKISYADGYYLEVNRLGSFALFRRLDGKATLLASATARIVNPAAMRVRMSTVGGHLVAGLDGLEILDVVDPDPPEARGAIALNTQPGTTRFDNIHLEIAPNRSPIARFHPFTGPALPKGFRIEIGDPDGVLDISSFRLSLDAGNKQFVDISFVLFPFFYVFDYLFTPDGRSIIFTLNDAAPIGPLQWTFRIETVDSKGHRTVSDLEVNSYRRGAGI